MGVDPALVGETGSAVGTVGGGGSRRVPGVSPGIADWRGDVALELWVETESEPPRVRLAGRLDATTAANLAQVVHELLADGTQEIQLCTEGLRNVDASGLGALADLERLVRARGGSLIRVGPTGAPFARSRLGASSPRPS